MYHYMTTYIGFYSRDQFRHRFWDLSAARSTLAAARTYHRRARLYHLTRPQLARRIHALYVKAGVARR